MTSVIKNSALKIQTAEIRFRGLFLRFFAYIFCRSTNRRHFKSRQFLIQHITRKKVENEKLKISCFNGSNGLFCLRSAFCGRRRKRHLYVGGDFFVGTANDENRKRQYSRQKRARPKSRGKRLIASNADNRRRRAATKRLFPACRAAHRC